MHLSKWFSPLAAAFVVLWGSFLGLVMITSLKPSILEEKTTIVITSQVIANDVLLLQYIYQIMKICVGITVGMSACFAKTFKLFSLQALLINVFIIFPVNTFFMILYRLLKPVLWMYEHLITMLLCPLISQKHVQPSFLQANMKQFVIATEIAFSAGGGVLNIFDDSDEKIRGLFRPLIDKYFPTLDGRLSEKVLVSPYFRIFMGYVTIPVCWWLVGEYLCNYITSDELEVSANAPTKSFKSLGENGISKQNETNDEALAVSFIIPKCKYLFAARETYSSKETGNKCCLHECRIGVEEISSRLAGHIYTVTPNLDTGSCTVCITAKKFNPELDW